MNLLEELIFTCGIPGEWVKKIEDEETDGYSTGNCGSIDVIQDYIISLQEQTKKAKKETITELLELHKQDRAKVNSQCDTLINMSTVEKYLRSLG